MELEIVFEDMNSQKKISPTNLFIAHNKKLFSIRASGGALIMVTKRSLGKVESTPPPPNIVSINPLGFQAYAEFYSPRYKTQEEKNSGKPDMRSTLYWNPKINITNGQANINFYTADEVSTYSIFIDGVSEYGEPLHYIGKFGE